jgi:hypothetical protein
MSRDTRLNNLSESSSIISRSNQGILGPGQVKLGIGYNNIVVGEGYVASNQESPYDPGFEFTRAGTRLTVGPSLRIDKDYKKTSFDNGRQMLHPLGDTLASTTANPLPTIMPRLQDGDMWAFSPSGAKALNYIRQVLG